MKKLVEKTKEDEATYKRVAEERKQLEEKVALLQQVGLSEENRQELKRVQFCLSQPVFYTNPDKMAELSRRIAALEELIKKVEELIRKVEEVEKQYPTPLGSSPSAPLMPQPSARPMNNGMQRNMSDPNVLATEFATESGTESAPSVHKTPTDGDVNSRRGVKLSQNTPVKVQGQQALFSQGATSPRASVQVSRRESFRNASSNGNMGAQDKTNRKLSLIYQSPKTKDDGNENQS